MAKQQRKTPKPSFPAGASLDEVAHSLLGELVGELRRATRQVRTSRDPEDLHHLRVSVRRLRVALRTFKSRLDESTVSALNRDLRWLFRRLGAVREYDVLLSELSAAQGEEDGALTALREELVGRRKVAERAARRALTSRRHARLRRALVALPRALAGERAPAPKSVRKWARKRLDKRRARVLALRAGLSEGDEQSLHALRKELKKLRYAADLLSPLWRRGGVKAYLRPLSDLQDLLGTLNDAAVSSRLLDAAGKSAGRAAARLAEQRVSELSETGKPARRRVERRLRRFAKAAPFWS